MTKEEISEYQEGRKNNGKSKSKGRASLVAQQSRIRPLTPEDPTCPGACHDYQA